jgi:hypothetical protein
MVLQGDFDGDGIGDSVLWITTGGSPRAVAVFSRVDNNYVAVDLGDEAAASTGVLELGRRGAPFQRAGFALELHFGLDTVVLRDCDGARTAFFWTGTGFQPEALAP